MPTNHKYFCYFQCHTFKHIDLNFMAILIQKMVKSLSSLSSLTFWRIYPTVIAYFLIIGSFPLISSSGGPLMNYMQKGSVDILIEHGWKQLLFISCFQPFKQMLMPIGWFISVDTQLYCLSFIVVYYMFNRPKLGFFLAFLMSAIGLVVHWIYLTLTGASPTIPLFTMKFDQFESMLELVYINTANMFYVSPYAICLILGYFIVHKIEAPKDLLDKIWWTALTAISFVMALYPHLPNCCTSVPGKVWAPKERVHIWKKVYFLEKKSVILDCLSYESPKSW